MRMLITAVIAAGVVILLVESAAYAQKAAKFMFYTGAAAPATTYCMLTMPMYPCSGAL